MDRSCTDDDSGYLMIAPIVLPIVELVTLESRCARSLPVRNTMISNLSPSTSQIFHKAAVVWSDAACFQASALGNRWKNPIQTP
jgi:hypothetical protein